MTKMVLKSLVVLIVFMQGGVLMALRAGLLPAGVDSTRFVEGATGTYSDTCVFCRKTGDRVECSCEAPGPKSQEPAKGGGFREKPYQQTEEERNLGVTSGKKLQHTEIDLSKCPSKPDGWKHLKNDNGSLACD